MNREYWLILILIFVTLAGGAFLYLENRWLAMAFTAKGAWIIARDDKGLNPQLASSSQGLPKARIVYTIDQSEGKAYTSKTEIHSINIDGTDDVLIYKGNENSEFWATVLGHRDILVELQNGTERTPRYFDSRGQAINDKYKGLNINSMYGVYNMPVYTADRNVAATIYNSTTTNTLHVQVLDVRTGELKDFDCGSLCNRTGRENHFNVDDFSRDGTKVLAELGDEFGATRYFYLDLISNTFYFIPADSQLAPVRGLFYVFELQYDTVLKYGLLDGPLDIIDVKENSTRELVNAPVYRIIFNGKDVIYTTAPRSAPEQESRKVFGVNVQSGEQYDVFPLRFGYNRDRFTLLDFLPNSAKFLYTTEYYTGSDLRIHDLDGPLDQSLFNFTQGTASDGSTYRIRYIGVIFE